MNLHVPAFARLACIVSMCRGGCLRVRTRRPVTAHSRPCDCALAGPKVRTRKYVITDVWLRPLFCGATKSTLWSYKVSHEMLQSHEGTDTCVITFMRWLIYIYIIYRCALVPPLLLVLSSAIGVVNAKSGVDESNMVRLPNDFLPICLVGTDIMLIFAEKNIAFAKRFFQFLCSKSFVGASKQVENH